MSKSQETILCERIITEKLSNIDYVWFEHEPAIKKVKEHPTNFGSPFIYYRPDFLVQYPDNKYIVIELKTSYDDTVSQSGKNFYGDKNFFIFPKEMKRIDSAIRYVNNNYKDVGILFLDKTKKQVSLYKEAKEIDNKIVFNMRTRDLWLKEA